MMQAWAVRLYELQKARTQIMAEATDPYKQAGLELTSQGRPKPKGDAWLMCARDIVER